MYLSEIAGKEIVNLVTGERLGVVGECDIIVDETDGSILALSIPRERGFLGLRKDKDVFLWLYCKFNPYSKQPTKKWDKKN